MQYSASWLTDVAKIELSSMWFQRFTKIIATYRNLTISKKYSKHNKHSLIDELFNIFNPILNIIWSFANLDTPLPFLFWPEIYFFLVLENVGEGGWKQWPNLVKHSFQFIGFIPFCAIWNAFWRKLYYNPFM